MAGYKDLVKEVGERRYLIKANTQEGWFSLRRLDARAEKDRQKKYLFEVELDPDPEKESGDVLNLQYFFVRTERALRTKREKGEDAIFILLVKVKNLGDMYRASAYLYLQSILRSDMHFYIQINKQDQIYEPTPSPTGLGRIPPLLYITGSAGDNKLSYCQLAQKAKLSDEQIEFCCNYAKEQATGTLKSEQAGEKDIPTEEGDATDNADETDDKAGPAATASEDPQNMTTLQKILSDPLFAEEKYQAICANYLIETFREIKGPQGHPLTREKKCELIESLCAYIKRKCDTITPLGQFMWFIYLRYLQDAREIVEWPSEDMEAKESSIRNDRLDKSYIDSVEYANGLLQLLENSCQHTQAKAGYLSMRIHYVDKACAESKLKDVAFNRSRLIKKYAKGYMEEGKTYPFFPRRIVLADDIPCYFELRVIDDASFQEKDAGPLRSRGISEMHMSNRHIEGSKDIELYQVFDRLLGKQKMPDITRDDETLDLITYHYGVKLLQKIVLRNCGYFLVSSPAIDSKKVEIYSSYPEEKLPDSIKDLEGEQIDLSDDAQQRRGVGWQQITCSGQRRATEYQILLPLSYRWNQSAEKSGNTRPPDMPLDLSMLRDRRQCEPGTVHSLDIDALKIPYFDADDEHQIAQKEKGEGVVAIQDKLTEIFENDKQINVDTIHVLDVSNLYGSRLELAAKALFRYIGKERMAHTQEPLSPLLFALYFKDTHWIQNFILEYSVFYDAYGRNPFMDHVQIAICCLNEDRHIPEVCFLLAGTKIASTRDTAEMFLYYNSGSARNLLPTLQYLANASGKGENDHKAVTPFPFDLYLREIPDPETGEWKSAVATDKKGGGPKDETADQDHRVFTAPADDCWFLQHMVRLIGNEMQMRDQGCKIPQIHVRLGSKMHIEDFYEAELLFQNIGVVSRMAFLIVRALLLKTPTVSTPLLVVGYENYSTILLEYVVQFLGQCDLEAAYGLYGFNSAGKGAFFPSAALSRKGKPFWDQCRLVTVYPIGTTLSTVYQMIDSVSDRCQLEPYMNFCVLVVTDVERNSPLQESYWSRRKMYYGKLAESAEEQSTLEMQPDKQSRPLTEVRYFLEAQTRWHDFRQCVEGKPHQEDVLTYVDRTSTVPNMIFPLSGRKSDGASSFIEKRKVLQNNERLERLRGCVLYGHTYSGNNHFLYNLDLSKYFGIIDEGPRDENGQTDLDKWLTAMNSEIDAEAYNVIVAPMDKDNSSFLHAIVNKVFAHSIRVLRIPFLEVRKEDIRAKFSFIADEYRKIKTANPDTQINIYYVATSVVTGETFYRATKLIGMLLEESGCYQKKDTFLFKGAFLLVNRSSRSTIQTMVRDPDHEFHAYLHLAVPHYNTYRGICPACLRKERSVMVLQNCATNSSAQNFYHMENKQELRTVEEYLSWQRRNLFGAPRTFSMLCLWLYRFRTQYPNSLDEAKIMALRDLLLEKRNQGIASPCLDDFRSEVEAIMPREELEQLWLDHVLQDRAFLRLFCTHKAYCALEDDQIINCDPKEAEQKAKALILELFRQECKKGLSPEEYIERIISYTKVLSREYLAKYHYIRQAIFHILTNLLRFMLEEPQKTLEQAAQVEVFEDCRRALPLQQYQLIITILKQLSGMQANLVMRDDILQDFAKRVDQLCREQSTRRKNDPLISLCPLPAAEEMERDYEICIKWGMLSGDEENKCLLLQQEQSIWRAESNNEH